MITGFDMAKFATTKFKKETPATTTEASSTSGLALTGSTPDNGVLTAFYNLRKIIVKVSIDGSLWHWVEPTERATGFVDWSQCGQKVLASSGADAVQFLKDHCKPSLIRDRLIRYLDDRKAPVKVALMSSEQSRREVKIKQEAAAKKIDEMTPNINESRHII